MDLSPIQLGDRDRTATGWLVSSQGAVRAVLTPYDAQVLLCFACDERVSPPDGFKRFRSIQEARKWLGRRLEPEKSKPALMAEPAATRSDLASEFQEFTTDIRASESLPEDDVEGEQGTEYVVLCDAGRRRHALRARAIIAISEAECGCELMLTDGRVVKLDCPFDKALSWLP